MEKINPWNRMVKPVLPVLLAALTMCVSAFAGPTVANVRTSQRAGTKLVDIYFDVSGGTGPYSVSVQVSNDAGATYAVAASSFGGDVGSGLSAGSGKHVVWNAGTDWDQQVSKTMRFKVVANDSAAPAGFALIPAGSFMMGDAMGDGVTSELPVHSVYVSSFYMEKLLVTKAQWDEVYAWAVEHGYSFDNVGAGKASNHPVQTVSWYDCVKWCNARSEKEGLTPCYITGTSGAVYRSGQLTPLCNWSRGGYRLPTEAEWEKAARGGAVGQRFPWGNTISRSQANYCVYRSGTSTTNYFPYDLGMPGGYDPAWATGGYPYTSPVGSYVANGYGLYDMAGNVFEWCWDWYGSYGSGVVSDPSGPASGSYRVQRGGGWSCFADNSRVSYRCVSGPAITSGGYGFRCVRR